MVKYDPKKDFTLFKTSDFNIKNSQYLATFNIA